jgi:hypothetical protein
MSEETKKQPAPLNMQPPPLQFNTSLGSLGDNSFASSTSNISNISNMSRIFVPKILEDMELRPQGHLKVQEKQTQLGLLDTTKTATEKLSVIESGFLHELVLNNSSKKNGFKCVAAACRVATTVQATKINHCLDFQEEVNETLKRDKTELENLEAKERDLKEQHVAILLEIESRNRAIAERKEVLNHHMATLDDHVEKYGSAQWLIDNPEPLQFATLDQVRDLTQLRSPEQVQALGYEDSLDVLRFLSRLGWQKSEYMKKYFNGRLKVLPRGTKVPLLHEHLISYLALVQEDLVVRAAGAIEREEQASAPPAQLLPEALRAIIEESEDDEEETTAIKRQLCNLLGELDEQQKAKKRRRNS